MIRSRLTAFLSALAVVILSGCKIEVPVPAGGYVTTQSGSFTCNARQTCVIEATDLTFDETFIAVADNGMKFVRWEKRDRGFFGGNTNDSVRLFTSGFRDNENLLAILRSNEVFYLQPVFAKIANTNEELASSAVGDFRRYGGAITVTIPFSGSSRESLVLERRIFNSSYSLGDRQLLLAVEDLALQSRRTSSQSHFYQDNRGAVIVVVDDDGDFFYRPAIDQFGLEIIPSPLVPNSSSTVDYELRNGRNSSEVVSEGRITIIVESKQIISTPQGTFSAYPIRVFDLLRDRGLCGEITEEDYVKWIVPEIGEVARIGQFFSGDSCGGSNGSLDYDYRLTGR